MSLIGTRSRKLNESGQAVIEYILVLTITVFLIGTFLYQFSTAFRKYANNFFGEYVACLLETGELPGQAKGECKDLMNPFNLADGKTATGKDIAGTGGVGSGQGGGSGSNSSSTSSNGKTGKNAKSGGNGSSSDSDSSSSSGGAPAGELAVNSTRGDGDGFGARSIRRSTPIRTSKDDGAGGAGGKGREALKPVGAYSGSDSSGSSSDGRGRRRALGRGFGFMGQEEQERREEERPATKAVAKDEGDGLRPKKVSVDTSRAPASDKDTGDSGFSIGNFLRVLIIAGILIAIFILFGGQLLAISKGGEK
jgi:hypothetical protein